MVLSIPFYGQSFTLRNASENGLRDATVGPGAEADFSKSPGFMAYYEICEKVESDGWEVVRDPSGSMGPYAFKGDQWVSYDDVTSIKDKLSFINDLGLGGARVWAIDLDDFRGKCASSARTYPLLRTINEELGIHLSNRAGLGKKEKNSLVSAYSKSQQIIDEAPPRYYPASFLQPLSRQASPYPSYYGGQPHRQFGANSDLPDSEVTKLFNTYSPYLPISPFQHPLQLRNVG